MLYLTGCAHVSTEPPVGRANSVQDFMSRWDSLENQRGKPDAEYRKLFGQALKELNATQAELARKQITSKSN